jgi:acetyl-CoA carboxylase carboxyltransferase component
MDFSFIGGSMGSVVGEKISRAIEHSLKNKKPFIMISKSGGARMMEAGYSLMQMAKTSAKLALLDQHKIPFISILTDPTTGESPPHMPCWEISILPSQERSLVLQAPGLSEKPSARICLKDFKVLNSC